MALRVTGAHNVLVMLNRQGRKSHTSPQRFTHNLHYAYLQFIILISDTAPYLFLVIYTDSLVIVIYLNKPSSGGFFMPVRAC